MSELFAMFLGTPWVGSVAVEPLGCAVELLALATLVGVVVAAVRQHCTRAANREAV